MQTRISVKRILVVDDDSMNLVRTRMILEKTYDVLLTESGAQALELLKREQIDLVLLDIEMPEMNGIETFEQMRACSIEVPVVFLTASGEREDVLDAIKLGAKNYLKKPFNPQELLKRVAKELEGK
ncbi:MAG: response regulator [Clostridiales bacterium]|nr:response regulator [Clostridiales bacterium]